MTLQYPASLPAEAARAQMVPPCHAERVRLAVMPELRLIEERKAR